MARYAEPPGAICHRAAKAGTPLWMAMKPMCGAITSGPLASDVETEDEGAHVSSESSGARFVVEQLAASTIRRMVTRRKTADAGIIMVSVEHEAELS